jgi:predicted nucleotidyltransferase
LVYYTSIEGLSFSFTLMRELLRKLKEHFLMIIRCHHLREVGIMNECCAHCHLLAGCGVDPLPNGHKAIFCCGCIDPLTPEAKETILAKIPLWEAQEKLILDASCLRGEGSPSSTIPVLPACFRPAYQAIQRLEGHERYLAAFIFDTVARGEAIESSDLDVQVIVNEKTFCRTINHPIIGGVQLNITFLSLEQFEERTRKEIDQSYRMRPLTIADSMIIFDKTGRLGRMREEAQQFQPHPVSAREQQRLQSMLFHCNKKAEYYLKEDPPTALLVMHMDLVSLLLAHYKQHQKWWVGPHRVLADLSIWDLKLAQLVGRFLAAGEVYAKFQVWSEIIDHILQPLGGHHPLPAQNCPCNRCQRDVSLLLEA